MGILQPVTDPAHARDHGGILRVALDDAAEAKHEVVDRPGSGILVVAPDVGEDLVAADRPSLSLDQEPEQLALLVRELGGPPVDLGLETRESDERAADPDLAGPGFERARLSAFRTRSRSSLK
jgi:hypothetical protein